MNGEQFARTKTLMAATMDVLRGEGIPVDQRNTIPLLSAARHAALAAQPVRAFDSADVDQGNGFRGRRPIGDDDDVDRECRAASHRVLDRLIDSHRERRRTKRRMTDEERQDQAAMLSVLPVRNAFPPGHALDADEGSDLDWMRRCAFESSGLY